MKKFGFALFLVFIAGASAWAYVPPSFYLVRTIARKHLGLEKGRFRNKVTVYKSGGELDRTFIETVLFTDSSKALIRLVDEAGAEVALRSRKLSAASDADRDWPISYDLLFLKDPVGIYDHLRTLGLPLKTEKDLYMDKEGYLPYKPEPTLFISRFESRVGYVVSADDVRKNPDHTQLWVERDSYLPMRLVLPGQAIEYRMSNYQPYRTFMYPRVTQVFRSGSLWVKIESLDVVIGEAPELERAKSKAEGNGDVRDFVAKYFQWVR